MKNKKRILFFAETLTTTHQARPSVLAQGLIQLGYEVAVAIPAMEHSHVDWSGIKRYDLFSIGSRLFLERINQGKFPFTNSEFKNNVISDLKVIDDFKPDFVIGDYRTSLAISARLRGIPYFSLINCWNSPLTKINRSVPQIPITNFLPVSVCQALYNTVGTIITKKMTSKIGAVYEEFGLSLSATDLYELYMDADAILFPDIPEYWSSSETLPDNYHFIGPVFWSAEAPFELESNWNHDNRKVVFISLGSSGNSNLWPQLFAAMNESSHRFIVNGPKSVNELKSHIHCFPIVPTKQAMVLSDLVVYSGSAMQMQQCLSLGKPSIAIPSNLDQFACVNSIEKFGASEILRPEGLTVDIIKSTIDAALKNSKMSERALSAAKYFSGWNPIEEVDKIIAKF